MLEASGAMFAALWERGQGLRGADRARALLACAAAGVEADEWTVGRRDAVLARVYVSLYGERVEATLRCADCDAPLEFETTVAALFGAAPPACEEPGVFCMRSEGYELTLRPVRVADVAQLPERPAAALDVLVRRCVIAAQRAALPVAAETLPAAVLDAVSAALSDADPNGDILVALSCVECGSAARIGFDIGTFLWEALEHSALQVFADVHVLAGAYGWSEREILAMSDSRRRRYLEFVLS